MKLTYHRKNCLLNGNFLWFNFNSQLGNATYTTTWFAINPYVSLPGKEHSKASFQLPWSLFESCSNFLVLCTCQIHHKHDFGSKQVDQFRSISWMESSRLKQLFSKQTSTCAISLLCSSSSASFNIGRREQRCNGAFPVESGGHIPSNTRQYTCSNSSFTTWNDLVCQMFPSHLWPSSGACTYKDSAVVML